MNTDDRSITTCQDSKHEQKSKKGSTNVDDINLASRSAEIGTEEFLCSNNKPFNTFSHSPFENIILSIFMCLKENNIALAVYKQNVGEIQVMKSILDPSRNFTLLKRVLQKLQPTFILTSDRNTQKLNRVFKSFANKKRWLNEAFTWMKLPISTYSNPACKGRIFSIEFSGSLANLDGDDKINYILSIVDFSDERLIAALGALLLFIRKELSKITLLTDINTITSFTIDDITWIDEVTLKNLQVFDPIHHPSSFKLSYNNMKEGLSLCNLIYKYCSKKGIPHLRAFMAAPTNNIDILTARHEVIQFCNDPCNASITQSIKSYIRHISSLPMLMSKISGGYGRGTQWHVIYQNLYYAVLIAEICQTKASDVQIFKKIADCLNEELYSMARHIYRIIDFDAFVDNRMYVVKNGVSEELDQAKFRYTNLADIMTAVSPYEFDAVPGFITEVQLVHIPEVKFVLSLPFWRESLCEEELDLPNLEFQFTSQKTAFYKSKRCLELDELFGDPQIDIFEEELKVLHELEKYLRKNINFLIILIEQIIELDCVLALADLAKENNYSQPKLVNERVLKIEKGWHPLLSYNSSIVIPNGYVSSPESSIINVICGPNASGKTVYLKQVALIVYMAHIGSYIPAESGCIGLLGHIFAHIQPLESVSTKLSTFMNDLEYLSFAIACCKENALIVLDEFGISTSETCRTAVFMSCIEYFSEIGENSPHILISSHYYLKAEDISGSKFSFHKMGVTKNDGTLVYLYRLQHGLDDNYPDEHLGHLSLPSVVKDSAKRVLLALRTGKDLYPFSETRLERSLKYEYFCKRLVLFKSNRKYDFQKIVNKVKKIYEASLQKEEMMKLPAILKKKIC